MWQLLSVLTIFTVCVADFPFVIEIYGFSPSLNTRDLLQEFHGYSQSEFCVKWVDDTHALGIFACERQGEFVLGEEREMPTV